MSVKPDDLTPGERVRVTIEGTVGATAHTRHGLRLDLGELTYELAHVWIVPEALLHVTITRLEPAGGIPQPGDMWGAPDGTVYAVIPDLGIYANPDAVQLINAYSGGGGEDWRTVHRERGPIRLLFRPPANRANAMPEVSDDAH